MRFVPLYIISFALMTLLVAWILQHGLTVAWRGSVEMGSGGPGPLLVGQSWVGGALAGAVGALIGAFGGYYARTRLVRALGVKDVFVAIPEDFVAIGLALLITFAR